VFYYGYDERAWTRQQILHDLAGKVLDKAGFDRFLPLSFDAQQKLLAERLRAERHLLILDNLESVRGEALAIANTLPPAEREALRHLLDDLAGGQTLVLLGSRGAEDWLIGNGRAQGSPLQPDPQSLIYDLGGLDLEAASQLADRILARHGATQYRGNADFTKLLKLLDGYPLALEVVLPNLARQTPAEVLAALQAGEVALDDAAATDKTHSILRCIEYSHSNLDPAAQELLACLVPFSTVIYTNFLSQYTEYLKAQPALANLPFDRWPEVLQAAADWGLMTKHDVPGYLRLQPIFPYFLLSRLNAVGDLSGGASQPDQPASPAPPDRSLSIRTAFRLHYDDFGDAIADAMKSKNPQERQTGQLLARLEYENLSTALDYALAAQTTIRNPYVALSRYLDATQDQRRGLELGQSVFTRLEQYPSEALAGQLGAEFVAVLDDIAKRQLLSQQYPLAEATYQKALSIHLGLTIFEEKQKAILSSGLYHQLGAVAQEQRQWAQAEAYYQQALAIEIEFNARSEQADTYHQLGIVAQKQRQWAQAEDYYKQALAIDVEFNDRYEQAGTYHQLGMVAREQRQWAQAENYYQQALAIKIEFNARYEQASTYGQLGLLAKAQGQMAQAAQHLQKALEIFYNAGDEYSTGMTVRNLGRLWHACDDAALKASLPAAVAGVLGVSAEEVVQGWEAS
jgi:tetratricopeptide (TPR) repeat protein